MIRIPNDYATTKGFDGTSSAQQLTPGGHICRIQGAHVEQTKTSGTDMLVVAFDIEEGGEFDGFYRAKYENARSFNPDAKWPGVFRTTILNLKGKTNTFFKGFIEAVEASNNGYNFLATNGNEQTLRNKLVGFNFGEEEYEYSDSKTGEKKVATGVKPAYAISVAAVREGVEVPQKKLLTRNAEMARASTQNNTQANNAQEFQEVDDDDFPF